MDLRVAAFASLTALLLGACGNPFSSSDSSMLVSSVKGKGAKQVFTMAFSDPRGPQYLDTVKVLVSEYMDGRAACFVQYSLKENVFFLVNDNGTGSTRMKAGDSGELSNSQCQLRGAGTSVTYSGTRLNLVLDLSFQPGFVGKKQVFLALRNLAGEETAFHAAGSWKMTTGYKPGDQAAPALSTAPKSVDLVAPVMSMAPKSGEGWSETFTFTYTSANGPSDFVDVRALFNRKANGASACYVAYDRATGTLQLADDDRLELASIPLKSAQTAGNSQCSVAAAGSSVVESASGLTWKLAVTFKPSFAGKKNVYLYALGSNHTDSGMQRKGTWVVPYGNQ